MALIRPGGSVPRFGIAVGLFPASFGFGFLENISFTIVHIMYPFFFSLVDRLTFEFPTQENRPKFGATDGQGECDFNWISSLDGRSYMLLNAYSDRWQRETKEKKKIITTRIYLTGPSLHQITPIILYPVAKKDG